MRMLLLALLLSVIGSAVNLAEAVRMGLKHQPKLLIAYLLGFTLLLLISWLLRTIIIRLVAFDLPAAMVKLLITGIAPDGSSIY